jgi:hypothetical protein
VEQLAEAEKNSDAAAQNAATALRIERDELLERIPLPNDGIDIILLSPSPDRPWRDERAIVVQGIVRTRKGVENLVINAEIW